MRHRPTALLALFAPACTVPDADPASTAAIDSVSIDISSDRVAELAADVHGTVALGFTSADILTLRLQEAGEVLWSETVSADSRTVEFDATVSLLDTGPNTIELVAEYAGEQASASGTVEVPAPITAVALEASGDRADEQVADVSGSVELGFTSSSYVTLRLVQGGEIQWSETVPADTTPVSFDATVPLLDVGTNTLELLATYWDSTASASTSVDLAAPIGGISIDASTDRLSERLTEVQGSVDLGYLGDSPLTLQVTVGGLVEWSETVFPDSTTVSYDATVPLRSTGPSAVEVVASYEGDTARASTSVTVPEPLLSLDVAPTESTATTLTSEVTGTVDLGYVSDAGATLTILVDGRKERLSTLDTSTDTSITIDETVPLRGSGSHTVAVQVSYDGSVLSDGFDVEVPEGLQDFALVPSETTATSRAVTITGTATLGYDDNQPVEAELLVDGSIAWASTVEPTADGSVSFDVPVTLPGEGEHAIIGVLSYGEDTRRASTTVTVPDGIGSFSASPDATTVDVYSVDVSGSVSLGYASDTPGSVSVFVEGSEVWTDTLDGSSGGDVAFSTTVPLAAEGSNEVIVEASYGERTESTSFTVTVTPPDATVSFPTFSSTYTYGSGVEVTGDVAVSAGTGWTTDAVWFSTDGGATWTEATDVGGGDWRVSVQDPDIGDTDLALRVETSNDGHTHDTWASDTFAVDPEFDCTSAASMLPDPDMIQNLKSETRTMMGYFGDPSAGHAVEFVLSGKDKNGDPYTVEGLNNTLGWTAISTTFNVDKFDCGGGGCDYDLDVYVDGSHLCSANNFGTIIKY